MLRTSLAIAVALAIPLSARADAYDNYTNPILAKAITSKSVEPVKQLTPEQMVQHSRVLPGASAAFIIVKTNDNRLAKLLVRPAAHKASGLRRCSSHSPRLRIEGWPEGISRFIAFC